MGKILRFRRRTGWTRPRDHGVAAGPRYRHRDDHVTVRGVARDTVGWLRRLRPVILGAILVSIWPATDPALVGPPSFLATPVERVDQHFTICGAGRTHACVVDGDTFRLGSRRIRVIGIDAPETHPARCPEEAELGAAATRRLRELLSRSPFEMSGWAHNPRDRYGRELMSISRTSANGTVESIAAEMRESGLARRYTGGFRLGWC